MTAMSLQKPEADEIWTMKTGWNASGASGESEISKLSFPDEEPPGAMLP